VTPAGLTPPGAKVPARLAPGGKVKLATPENVNHFRKGLAGVVRESGLYTPPRPRNWKEGDRDPPTRVWLWVDFPACPHNGSMPFGSFLWGNEVAPVVR
jgi:hypothetical protein